MGKSRFFLSVASAALLLNASATLAQTNAGGARGAGGGATQGGAAQQGGAAMGQGGSMGQGGGGAQGSPDVLPEGGKPPAGAARGKAAPGQAEAPARPTAGSGEAGDNTGAEPQAAPGAAPKAGQPNRKAANPEAQDGGQMKAGNRPAGQAERRPARIDREHQGRVRDVIRGLGVRELAGVTFALTVGTRVPRDIDLRPLPREIIEIYPDYEGYDFVLVHGDIVVIDPDTDEIVDVFPA